MVCTTFVDYFLLKSVKKERGCGDTNKGYRTLNAANHIMYRLKNKKTGRIEVYQSKCVHIFHMIGRFSLLYIKSKV